MALERLEELRRIAQMAKKVVISVQEGNDCSVEDANVVALYINTFDPMTVLDLLDELEWLWREREGGDPYALEARIEPENHQPEHPQAHS